MCIVGVAAVSAVAALREWESPSHAAQRSQRIAGVDYRAVTGQMQALTVVRARIAPGLRTCGARLDLRSFDGPLTCFRDASNAFVRSAFGLWTTLGGLDARVATPCQTQIRNLRLQLDLSATLVKQANMAAESLDFDHFHSLAAAIPQLAPMYDTARRQFAAACSPPGA